uniref:Uncharacterized protein n=1 Tax=Romanomermis culicivorax TaxID=13658 RepID=A0A915IA24_ROMCU
MKICNVLYHKQIKKKVDNRNMKESRDKDQQHSVCNLASGIRIWIRMPVQQVDGSDGNSYFFRCRKGWMTIYS